MAISLVAIATATLILFLDVALELIEVRISFYIFFWFSCRQFLFTKSVCARLAQLVGSLTANQEVPGTSPGLVEG